jgi:hypothetical protein
MDPRVYRETEQQLNALCRFVRAVQEEPDRLDSSPTSIHKGLSTLFQHQGRLEGNLLKGWGLISEELQTVLEHYTRCLQVEVTFSSPFSVPFEGKSIQLRASGEKTDVFLPLCIVFLEALLSSYSIKPLKLSSLDPKASYIYTVQEKEEVASGVFSEETGGEWGKEFRHQMNNYLGGITSFASLLSKEAVEKQGLDSLEESREAILEAVQSIREYIKKTIPK